MNPGHTCRYFTPHPHPPPCNRAEGADVGVSAPSTTCSKTRQMQQLAASALPPPSKIPDRQPTKQPIPTPTRHCNCHHPRQPRRRTTLQGQFDNQAETRGRRLPNGRESQVRPGRGCRRAPSPSSHDRGGRAARPVKGLRHEGRPCRPTPTLITVPLDRPSGVADGGAGSRPKRPPVERELQPRKYRTFRRGLSASYTDRP
jgi:hypothetical protein